MQEENKSAPLTRDERIKELLEKSGADAVKDIKGPSLSDLAQPELKSEDTDIEPEETPSGGKKIRIPASRFKKLTEELKELRETVQQTQSDRERIAALEAQLQSSSKKEDDLPEWWKQAYGDDENSKLGYKNQLRIMREEMAKALEDRERAKREAEEQRQAYVESIEKSFDEQMDSLEETLGRELTDNQKSEILDIVGEYSPQENGQYVAYMPVEKAYELWQKGRGVNQGKQEMARIAGAQSSGGTGVSSSQERPQWGDWRKKYGF